MCFVPSTALKQVYFHFHVIDVCVSESHLAPWQGGEAGKREACSVSTLLTAVEVPAFEESKSLPACVPFSRPAISLLPFQVLSTEEEAEHPDAPLNCGS